MQIWKTWIITVDNRAAGENPIIVFPMEDRIMSALIDFLHKACIINHGADNKSDFLCCVTFSYWFLLRCEKCFLLLKEDSFNLFQKKYYCNFKLVLYFFLISLLTRFTYKNEYMSPVTWSVRFTFNILKHLHFIWLFGAETAWLS